MKKRGLMGLLAVGLLVGLLLPASVPVLADPGMVGYWTFNEESGLAIDYSGNGNDGILAEEAGRSPSPFGAALSVDGVDDYAYVADDSSLDGMSALTVAAWVNIDSPGTWYKGIVDKTAGTSNRSFNMGLRDGYLEWGIANSTSNTKITITDPNLADLGEWIHVAGTYDGTVMRLYVDGSEVASGAQSGNVRESTTDLMFGRWPGNSAYCFDGLIDEVGIWDEALSSTQIASLAAGASPIGSVGWLPPVTEVDFVLQDGTTLPLKFQLFEDGSLLTDQQNVWLEIAGPDSFTSTYYLGDGVESLRWNAIDWFYIANLKTRDDGWDSGTYTATVVVGGLSYGEIAFELSTEKGCGRGNSGK